MIQLAEKHNLQHISEGDGDQRHITIIKNTPVQNITKKEPVQNNKEEEDEIHESFRSFSVLEEEKKDSIQMIDKTTSSSKTISDQNLISPEDRVRKEKKQLFFSLSFNICFLD